VCGEGSGGELEYDGREGEEKEGGTHLNIIVLNAPCLFCFFGQEARSANSVQSGGGGG
jgi:hypothetical protein